MEAVDDFDIIELTDISIDPEPITTSTRGGVDDLDAAPGLAVRVIQFLVNIQSFEPFVAWPGKADESKPIVKSKSAQEPRAKRDRYEFAMN